MHKPKYANKPIKFSVDMWFLSLFNFTVAPILLATINLNDKQLEIFLEIWESYDITILYKKIVSFEINIYT